MRILLLVMGFVFVAWLLMRENHHHLCDGCPPMVLIPAGTAILGSPETEPLRSKRDFDQEEFVLKAPFYLSVAETTVGNWRRCVSAGACAELPYRTSRTKYPVGDLSFQDVSDYLDWLSVKSKRVCRLPTEAEWEYAARAYSKHPFYFGEMVSLRDGNFDALSGICYSENGLPCPDHFAKYWDARTHYLKKVKSYRPNAFGLYDMHGNVWEMTQSCWDGENYSSSRVAPDDCSKIVIKGGSYFSGISSARAAYKAFLQVGERSPLVGFRVLCETSHL